MHQIMEVIRHLFTRTHGDAMTHIENIERRADEMRLQAEGIRRELDPLRDLVIDMEQTLWRRRRNGKSHLCK